MLLPRAGLAQKKDFVAKALCPRILVVSSADITDSCQVNNLESLSELIEPFGQDVSTQITIQDGQGAPYFLDKINIRFISDFIIEKQKQLSNTEVDELVKNCVIGSAAADSADPAFIKDSSGIDKEAAANEEISIWSPWYTLFRQQWVNSMQASEHESFMHPVACLLAVSGSDADPVGSLRNLANHAVVRRAQTQSFAGTNMMLFYMVIHDERHATDTHNVDHRFDQVRKAFGQNCSLLRINSNTDLIGASDSSERTKISGIWSNSRAALQPLAPVPEKVYGGMLTMRDVAALRDAVKQMMVRGVIPHMQYVVRQLSDHTANQRRGITGRLFSAGRRYFGNAGKASSMLTGVDGETYFRYDSPEAMMRQLADYSFMLKDFRFAQSVYQVARRDFLAEKAWKCYAGAQEMVGLCKLMWEIQATKAEFDSNFDDAITIYLHKSHCSHPFLAIRSVILYYELLKHHKMLTYAPVALLRVPRVHVSLNALMSEQAAYSFLKFTPRPEVRKFSFYAMIASQQFQRADMGEMAHRCLRMVKHALATPAGLHSQSRAEEDEKAGYTEEKKLGIAQADASDHNSSSSSEVTTRSSWAAIDSFVNHELGRQCMAAQNYDEALQYFMALMSDDKIPPKLQNKYLQELLQLFLESDDQAALHATEENKPSASVQLSIPNIDPLMARIIMSPNLEGEDGMLEWRLDGSAPAFASTVGGSVVMSPQQKGRKCCSVGETVAVLLVVTNPLTIGVTLNSFTLDCEFTAAGEQNESEAFEVTTVPSVILEGGQTSMVTVEIVAKQPGDLSIIGAKFLLCDILPTFKSLRLPGRRLNDTKEQRMTPVYSSDTSLGFRVDPELPHLHITMHDFPDTLMSGSVHKAAIHIANQGNLPCRGIALWLSHPSFFDIKSPHILSDATTSNGSLDVYQKQAIVNDTDTLSVHNALQDCSEFLLIGDAKQQLSGARHLVPIECLAPGETLVVPLWARGDRVGDHSLKLSVGSCANTALQTGVSRVMRSRTFDVDLLVTPSLRVNAFVRPSSKNPQERLLGIEVENMQTDISVQLVQTTFSSGHYQLVPIFVSKQKTVPGGKVTIGPRQTINLMYRARPYQGHKQESLEHSSSLQTTMPEWFTINALRQYIYSNEKPKRLPEPIDLIYSNAVLGDHEGIDCVHSSLQNYIVRSQSHRRRNMLRANYPMIPEKYHHVIFSLFETFGIDFVLFWAEIGGAMRSGHHSITGIDLGVPHDYVNEALNPPEEGAARAWLANTINEREMLIQSIANRAGAMANRHERVLDVAMRVASVNKGIQDANDESKSIMYIADIRIAVRNHSWRYGYKGRLDLLSPADLEQLFASDKIRLDYSGSRSSWSWLEKPTFSFIVGPQQSVEVNAKIACLTSGVVDIGLWKLRAAALEPSKNGTVEAESIAAKAQYGSKSLECTIYPVLPCFISVVDSRE
ncbi:hypothetical protein FB645_003509 [Coemansia sp. IMI 203386]|nr:hypothetical protein FB645_003509 [Coemansia sp. IMI 203386]